MVASITYSFWKEGGFHAIFSGTFSFFIFVYTDVNEDAELSVFTINGKKTLLKKNSVAKADTMMKQLILTMTKAMVENPEKIQADVSETNHMIYIRVKAGSGETGKLIGKNGRNVNALRTVLKAAASKEKKRVFLEIVNEESSTLKKQNQREVIYLNQQIK